MASINLNAKLTWSESPDTASLSGGGASLTQVATGRVVRESDQQAGTDSEAVDIGDLTYPLYMLLKNMDGTNYVDVALDNANSVNGARLLPDGGTYGPIYALAAHYLKSNGAACNVRVLLVKP